MAKSKGQAQPWAADSQWSQRQPHRPLPDCCSPAVVAYSPPLASPALVLGRRIADLQPRFLHLVAWEQQIRKDFL